MIIYVESNFILELVLAQEESTSAEQILDLAEKNLIKLVLPSFSMMEPFWTIQGRGKQHVKQQLVEEEKVFVSRNWKDFDQEEIVEELKAFQCKFFSNFYNAMGYVNSRL